MIKLTLVTVGMFVGFVYTLPIIGLIAWKNDVSTDKMVLAALGWAIFTLGAFW